jgi:serine/threonine protein phosphatase PrpC
MIRLKQFAAKSHQGPFLQGNEDDVEIDLKDKFYVLYDGFGGSSIGDECVKICKQQIKQFFIRSSKDKNSTMPFFFSPKYSLETNAFINGIHLAHKKILEFNSSRSMTDRGGVSLVAVVQSENIISLISIGNCKSYFYSNGNLRNLTIPDDLSAMNSDPRKRHYYSCPMSGIGLFDYLDLKVMEVKPRDEDLLVLVSDGVHAYVDDHELCSMINSRTTNLTQKIDNLMNLANSRGNLDNQSTVLLHF